MAVVHWVQCPWVHLALLGQLAGQVTGLMPPWAPERGVPCSLIHVHWLCVIRLAWLRDFVRLGLSWMQWCSYGWAVGVGSG